MGKPSEEKCQSEVKYLLEKLSSWKEEINEQLSNIIDSHASNINKGINDMAEEVCDLRSKHSVITKERDDLLKKVAKLSSENTQLRAAINIIQPLPDPQESILCGVRNQNNRERRPRVTCETRDQEQHLSNSEISYSIDELKDKNPLDNQRILFSSTYTEYTNADDIEIKHESLDEGEIDGDDETDHGQEEYVSGSKNNLTSLEVTLPFQDHICPDCSLVLSTKENLRLHFINSHPKLELTGKLPGENHESSDISDNLEMKVGEISRDHKLKEERNNSKRGENVKCDQCPYETIQKINMNEHIKFVHENIRNHKCTICGCAFKYKSCLKRHIYSVHKMGEKKFKCNQCSYSAYQNAHLIGHVKSVHDKIRDFKCEECDYAASYKGHLKQHRKSVHKMG